MPVMMPLSVQNRKAISGQALVWFLAFAGVMALAFAGVYSTGQSTVEKEKITNAGDAAAYSAGLFQARTLNAVAYTNRAMVANEVFIAQMVSMDSWLSYFKVATANYEKVFSGLRSVPYVGAAFAVLAQTMRILNNISDVADQGLDTALPKVVELWESFFKTSYKGSVVPPVPGFEKLFTPPIMVWASNAVAQQVLQENVARQDGKEDSSPQLWRSDWLSARNEWAWQQLPHLYAAQTERKKTADLVLQSRDAFSIERLGSSTFFIDWFFGGSFCIPGVIKVGSDKKGATRLSQNLDKWEAEDTLEYKLKVPARWDCSWGKGTTSIPVGWGRATEEMQSTLNAYSITRDARNATGKRAVRANHFNEGWSGIKSIYDVKRLANDKPQVEEGSYIAVAYKDAHAIKTHDQLGFMNQGRADSVLGNTKMEVGFAKNRVATIAKAKIFFARPVRDARDGTGIRLFRADTHQEYASLYNPYWQTRLTEVGVQEKSAIYAAMGISLGAALWAQ